MVEASSILKHALRDESCVRLGRQDPCEVVVANPSVSKLHCYLEVEKGAKDGESRPSCFVRDVSTNGTWVLRGGRAGDESVTSTVGSVPARLTAEKLAKGKRVELAVGDTLLLLAPRHEESQQCRFVLEMGEDKEFTLRQCLPGENAMSDKPREKEEEKGLNEITQEGKPGSGTDIDQQSAVEVGRVKEKRASSVEVKYMGATKRMKLEPIETSVGASTAEADGPEDTDSKKCALVASSGSGTGIEMSSEERCPICRKLFPPSDLVLHSASCQVFSDNECDTQEPADSDSSSAASSPHTLPPGPCALKTAVSVEHCPKCLKLFPVPELVSHWESCTSPAPEDPDTHVTVPVLTHSAETVSSARECLAAEVHSETELCPICMKPFPISELLVHSENCREPATGGKGLSAEGGSGDAASSTTAVEERRVYTLEPHVPTTASTGPELEQCAYCLKDVLLSELVSHSHTCPMRERKEACTVEEHCQHCLKVFPLDELVSHSLTCSSRKHTPSISVDVTGGGVTGSQEEWGEPLERCMHCFRDFPLSVLVNHSAKCTGDMLGSRERFKGFLPSIHDLDPMALAVLSDTQARAVEYVIKKSKVDSERRYPELKSKVERLGYSEKDLERVLLWVRHEAPIIIHISLDRVLHFLVKDTHYRNQFETGTSSGCTDLRIRGSWEDRIFNNAYARSPPVDRVKYGVLNIVGDPRGVRSCYSYGDSFIQLKKVRLRTTFASADTSCGGVKLSCCEHYSNVLVEYTDYELKAILEVATRKKSFLHSSVISTYKEIQIHGPVCLSENVECIVVNNRHSRDTDIGDMLDEFVKRNGCNLIWMEPEDSHSYPTIAAPAPMTSTESRYWAMERARDRTRERRRERRRRRRRRRRMEEYSDY